MINKCSATISSVLLTIMSTLFIAKVNAESGVDLLTITEIKNIQTASGIDEAGEAAIVGGVVVGTVVGTGAAIATGNVAAAEVIANSGVNTAIAAGQGAGKGLGDLMFSGNDDLQVYVNGTKVLNTTEMHKDNVNRNVIKASFVGTAWVQLVEYDSESDNDNLGSFVVKGTETKTTTVRVFGNDEEGSEYLVTYVVTKNAGSISNVPEWMMCGTNQCDTCAVSDCSGHDYSQLDRDGDIEDLLQCPASYTQTRIQKYEQVIVDNVFLRVCQNQDVARFKSLVTKNRSGAEKPLKYGDSILLKNMYGPGSYLDTREYGCEGNALCVSLSASKARSSFKTSYWTIIPKDKKYLGQPVKSGDLVSLANQMEGWDKTNSDFGLGTNKFGGYLDTRGAGCERSDTLCVSTAQVKNRENNYSSTWEIVSKIKGENLYIGDKVMLQNKYKYKGGYYYLDTLGSGCEENFYCVSANVAVNRSNGTGIWEILSIN
jgi:hypothetical protein